MQWGVLQELHALNTRLGRLMPPPDPHHTLACDGLQESVIEAQPAGVWPLVLPVSLSGLDRRVTRADDDEEAGPAPQTPSGLCLWQPTDLARRLAVQARHDIEALYLAEMGRSIGARLPAHNADFQDGTYSLFGHEHHPAVLYSDALRVFSSIYRSLARLCEEYARMLCRIYGVPLVVFRETTRLTIARTQPGRGVPVAALPCAPHACGPVATATLGPEARLWDALAPPPEPSMRVALEDATLATVDGHARHNFLWGEPEGSCERGARFRINFYMSSRWARVLDGCGPVLATPIRAERVVMTRPPPGMEACPPALDTPVMRAIHDMHTRLTVCESRLCVEPHTLPFALAHQR